MNKIRKLNRSCIQGIDFEFQNAMVFFIAFTYISKITCAIFFINCQSPCAVCNTSIDKDTVSVLRDLMNMRRRSTYLCVNSFVIILNVSYRKETCSIYMVVLVKPDFRKSIEIY